MRTCLVVYFGTAFLAIFITPLVIKLANKIKAVDKPGIRTVHSMPIPRIGGVAIFCSAMVFIIAALFLNNDIGRSFREMHIQLLALFGSAAFIFFIGLIDDLKGLPAKFKLISEFLASGLLCFAGVHITSIDVTEQWTVHFALLSWPLTIFWIVGITNAVNLSDGLDGLAAGISVIACAVIAIFALRSDNAVMAILMLALLGSLSGFLFYNFNPAKIFMGDSGSLFLGFTIASSSILCSMKTSALIAIALPALALGIPIFDTLFSMLRRFLERRSIFSPDKRHFHHRLIEMGLKQRQVVIAIYIITLLFTGLGMFMIVTRDLDSLVVFISILILLVIVFNKVGSVRLKETVSSLQKKYEIAERNKREQANFEQVQLYFYNAKTTGQWWTAFCKAAERLDFAWLSLKTTYEDGQTETEIWRMSDSKPDLSKLVIMTVLLSGNGNGTPVELEAAISVNGSYESAGHRATLFNRLVDENCASFKTSQQRVSKLSSKMLSGVR